MHQEQGSCRFVTLLFALEQVKHSTEQMRHSMLELLKGGPYKKCIVVFLL